MSQYSIFIHFNKPGATIMSFLWVNGTLLCLAFELADSYTTHLVYHIHLTQISHLRRFARGKFSFLFWSFSHFLRPLNSRGRFRWFCISLENTFPVFSPERSFSLILSIRPLNHRSFSFLTLFYCIGALLANLLSCRLVLVRWLVDSLALSVVFI